MPSSPTVMLCVGAKKAGTSWFYDYLRGHPECALGSVKELHYFDAKDLDEGWVPGAVATEIASIQRLLLEATDDVQLAAAQSHLVDLEELQVLIGAKDVDETAYLSYLFEKAGSAKMVGDLTPAYSLLGETRLRSMSQMTENVRFVYLLRDPLDRLWSHVRMVAKNTLKPGEDLAKAARKLLTRIVRHGEAKHVSARGDYPAIIAKLCRAIPPEKLRFEFFEELLTEEGLRRICMFLGLTYVPGKFAMPVHVGAPIEMNTKQKAEAQALLAPHYAFVNDTFGYLPDRWRQNMARI